MTKETNGFCKSSTSHLSPEEIRFAEKCARWMGGIGGFIVLMASFFIIGEAYSAEPSLWQLQATATDWDGRVDNLGSFTTRGECVFAMGAQVRYAIAEQGWEFMMYSDDANEDGSNMALALLTNVGSEEVGAFSCTPEVI